MSKKPTIIEAMAQSYRDYATEANKNSRCGDTASYSCVITNAATGEKIPVDVDMHM